ncbi:hypothetical protein FLA_4667 [Filimonas lacunae]|nr:hypothetical protein FLA_4667 [Filimonas lacunae]
MAYDGFSIVIPTFATFSGKRKLKNYKFFLWQLHQISAVVLS